MKAEDPYHLRRFVAAQDAGGTYDRAAAELRAGRKTSHWMWFVFPQIAGLGYSPVSQMYAITSLEEARAYLAHPVLGARLIECATILTGLAGRTAEQVFGDVDALKLCSASRCSGTPLPKSRFSARSWISISVANRTPRPSSASEDHARGQAVRNRDLATPTAGRPAYGL